jgi:hypothetical protein
MTFGARFSHAGTNSLTLTDESYSTVFRGKASLIRTYYPIGFEDVHVPPYGLMADFEITLAWPDPPITFVTVPNGYFGVIHTQYDEGVGRWTITASTTHPTFVPECYVFQRLNYGEAVRGNYGMVIYGPGGPSGRPVFSTNRMMCNPWATQVVATPASNAVPYNGSWNVSISNTEAATAWPPGTVMPPKPAVMMYAKNGCCPPGGASLGNLVPGVRLDAGQAVVGWVGYGFEVEMFTSPYNASANQNVVSVINGATYD